MNEVMMTIHRAQDHYSDQNSWLTTRWHFSFGHYVDEANMNWGPLRVFNDDEIAPHSGFPLHAHADMEIVTYILEGELSHEDDLGNIGTLTYPEVQRMSAGTGIRHAEFNPTNAPLKLFQMWVLPSQLGLPPSWEQKGFPDEGMKKNQWALICSPDGRKGSLTIHQDAYLYATRLGKGNTLSYSFRSPSRLAYIVIAEGKIDVEKQTLFPRDAARVKGVNELVFTATTDAHFLLWDLPGN